VVLDLYRRDVVAWMLAPRESAALAKRLIATACGRQGITRGQLTTHRDRGIVRSLSRPRWSSTARHRPSGPSGAAR